MRDDTIEQLQAELEQKRSELGEAQRLVSDLKEELDIFEKKQLALSGERDLLISKNRDQVFQMNKHVETIQDKEEKIEQL